MFPALIPFLPFSSFALKGAILGIVWNAGLSFVLHLRPSWASCLILTMTPVVTFLSLNFTGSSTYTNLSGARREVQIGLPVLLGTGIFGVCLAIAGLVLTH